MESPTRRHDSLRTPARDRTQLAVVCLSPQEWQIDLPTNRQQIMIRVRQQGHDVPFVETGRWAGRCLRALVRGPNRLDLVTAEL